MDRDTFLGAMLGAALGDAMGRPVEFEPAANAGLAYVDLPCPALVTDDTQLALAVAWALLDAAPALGVLAQKEPNQKEPNQKEPYQKEPYRVAPALEESALEVHLVRRLAQWAVTDHHEGRAPGTTCLDACWRLARLDDPAQWPSATVRDSKGCGGVMRAHPAVLLTKPGDPAPLLQSAMTHGHPAACTAVLAWEGALRSAADGQPPQEWLQAASMALDVPRPDLLEPLTRRPDYPAEAWWPIGVAETRSSLCDAVAALEVWDDLEDPCRLSGPGWIAEEAVATSLVIAVRYADDPVGALRRATRTCGDSDTLASMVGALLGARHGAAAWPRHWVDALEEEYRAAILNLVPA